MRRRLARHCTLADSDVTSRHHLESGMIDRRNGLTYADSGVDIDAGNRLVDLIKPMVRATARTGADAEIGGFGGLFDLKAAGFKDPVLVAATDGVGTKVKIANAISIWLDAIAQTMNGTSRMRPSVMMFGILTRRFPATGLIFTKDPALFSPDRFLST